MELFINHKIWEAFSEKEMQDYKDELFRHYRSNGFPYFSTDKEYRLKEFEKLKSYDYTTIIEGDIIKQTMHGLALAWSFMPHSVNIKCQNMKTPLEVFNNDEDLKKVITKRLQMGSHMSDNGIKKMIKMYTGAQSVSNFRPTAAAAIYHKFAPNGIVWDMSAGFGGRLLGAIVSGTKYIGTDPASATFDGLCQIKDMFSNETDVKLYKIGSEKFTPEENSLDLCFTSPPYFNCEKYSDEKTQSYIKYPTKEKWTKNFLGKTFRRCYFGLKNDKKMIINIANTKEYPDLEEKTIETAEDNGFKLEQTMKLALSNSSFVKDKHAFKYEPVYIFKKI